LENEAWCPGYKEAQLLQILPPKGRRRVAALKEKGLTEAERQRYEEKQREGAIGSLLELLSFANMPVLGDIQESQNPTGAAKLVVGGLRTSTMMKYIKQLYRIHRHTVEMHQLSWPASAAQVIDYVQALLEEPAAPSVPQCALQALGWFEKVGNLKGDDRYSKSTMVINAFESSIITLARGVGPTMQAARFPAVVLASLELFIANCSNPAYLRFIAGTHLLRAWGTLRLDDLQHLDPRKLIPVGKAICATLLSSKTSGPGKRNKELPVAVLKNSSLLGIDWWRHWRELDEGLWDQSQRSYVVPARPQTPGSIPKMANYAEISGATKRLMSLVKLPGYCKDTESWFETPEFLHEDVLMDFYTEHSGRSVMPSLAAFIEAEKSKRDMLGRWRPSGSDDYVRTYSQIVVGLQERVIRGLQEGEGLTVMKEEDVVARLRRHLLERKKLDDTLTEMICKAYADRVHGFHALIAAEVRKEDWVEVAEELPAPMPKARPATTTRWEARGTQEPEADFLISYNRSGSFGRLHSTKQPCYWAQRELKNYMLVTVPLPGQYNARCRACWPKPMGSGGPETEGSSSSPEGTEEEEPL
jgi:hypothetical protein